MQNSLKALRLFRIPKERTETKIFSSLGIFSGDTEDINYNIYSYRLKDAFNNIIRRHSFLDKIETIVLSCEFSRDAKGGGGRLFG